MAMRLQRYKSLAALNQEDLNIVSNIAFNLPYCDNAAKYAEYLRYLDFWKSYPKFSGGRSLEDFYRKLIKAGQFVWV
jgi:hypothetical protein